MAVSAGYQTKEREMKKIIVLVVLVLVVISGTTFARPTGFAIGAAFGINELGTDIPMSALLSFKLPQFPVMFGAGMRLNESVFNLALTADWWLYRTHLVGVVSLYIGPGLYITIPDNVRFGLRLPVGIQAFIIEPFELFLEIAPTITIVAPEGIEIPSFGAQGAVGFRFWF